MVGLRVSTEGSDVKTATGRDLVYDSTWGSLKIVARGSGIASGSGEATIAHGLNYTPMFFVYDDNNWKGTGYWSLNGQSYINTTNLEIRTGASKNYRYILMANELAGINTEDVEADTGVLVSSDGVDVNSAKLGGINLNTGLETCQVYWRYGFYNLVALDDVWTEGTPQSHGMGFVPFYLGLGALLSSGGGGDNFFFFLSGRMMGYNGDYKQTFVDTCADSYYFYTRTKVVSAPETLEGGGSWINPFILGKLF
jgi:hypothetical protein